MRPVVTVEVGGGIEIEGATEEVGLGRGARERLAVLGATAGETLLTD